MLLTIVIVYCVVGLLCAIYETVDVYRKDRLIPSEVPGVIIFGMLLWAPVYLVTGIVDLVRWMRR